MKTKRRLFGKQEPKYYSPKQKIITKWKKDLVLSVIYFSVTNMINFFSDFNGLLQIVMGNYICIKGMN